MEMKSDFIKMAIETIFCGTYSGINRAQTQEQFSLKMNRTLPTKNNSKTINITQFLVLIDNKKKIRCTGIVAANNRFQKYITFDPISFEIEILKD